VIENPNDLGIVRIVYDEYRKRNPSIIQFGSANAMKGAANLIERSYTGRL
jgi:hypothetical protein